VSGDAQNEPALADLHPLVKLAQTGIPETPLIELGRGVVVIVGHDDLRPLTAANLRRYGKVLLCQTSLLLLQSGPCVITPFPTRRQLPYDIDMRLS